MKKYIYAALIVLFIGGCSTHVPKVEKGYVIDFSRYINDGIFISVDPYYGGKFTPIGMVKVTNAPAIKLGKKTYENETYFDIYSALDYMVSVAKKHSANAITDIKIKSWCKSKFQCGYEIDGFLIRIESKKIEDE